MTHNWELALCFKCHKAVTKPFQENNEALQTVVLSPPQLIFIIHKSLPLRKPNTRGNSCILTNSLPPTL